MSTTAITAAEITTGLYLPQLVPLYTVTGHQCWYTDHTAALSMLGIWYFFFDR
jgi:hypothetical protein